MARIGIVSTIINAQHVLPTFVTYHRAVGIGRFWFFLDDPTELPACQALHLPDCVFIPRDAQLLQAWSNLASWPANAPTVDTDQMSRQALNTDLAIGLATQAGVDWLLHIDSDELFYLPSGNAIDYFAARSTYGTISFPNHEAIPEAVEISDYFRAVSLFKRNPQTLPWYERPAAWAFNFYGNGKSAVHLTAGPSRSNGPHQFLSERPGLDERDGVAILHYPVCGLGWYQRKYQVLGQQLSDYYYGSEVAGRRFAADLRGRDALCHPATLLHQYTTDIMNQGLARRADGLQRGLLFRVDLTAELSGQQRPTTPWTEPPLAEAPVAGWVKWAALVFACLTGLGVSHLVHQQRQS